jgi:hypothetical protein
MEMARSWYGPRTLLVILHHDESRGRAYSRDFHYLTRFADGFGLELHPAIMQAAPQRYAAAPRLRLAILAIINVSRPTYP